MKRIVAIPLLGALAILATMAEPARADLINITQYDVNQAGGGLNIQANYDLTGSGITCDPANIRWIQRILLKDGNGNQKDNVPGYPSGNFIDPQPGQPGGPWDTLPWYDVTYNTADDRDNDVNRQNGAGAYFNDSPNGWGPFGPMSFNATTAIVCINSANCTFQILGGFTWGFSVAADQTITAIPTVIGLMNDAATRKLFNDALDLGPASFSKWQAVPEPSSVLLISVGLAGMRLVRRRRGRAAPPARVAA